MKSANDELFLETIKSVSMNKDAVIKCPDCNKSILVHPFYTERGINVCGYCNKSEEIIKNMVKSRGWKFLRFERKGTSKTIYFTCSNDHNCTLRKDLTYHILQYIIYFFNQNSPMDPCNQNKIYTIKHNFGIFN